MKDYIENSCENCGQCVCLSCTKRDQCRCDMACEDKPLTECGEVDYEDDQNVL